MEDDISFDFDSVTPEPSSESVTPEPSQEATAPVETTAPPAQPSPEIAELRRELEAAKRWQQDVARVFGGQPQQQPQQDPLQEFVQDPAGFRDKTIEMAVQKAKEEARTEALIADRRSKNPELAKVEHLVNWDVAMQTAGAQLYQKLGRNPSFEEALDAAISTVKESLGLSNTSQAQQGDASKRMAMSLDIAGSSPPTSQPKTAFDIPDSDWPKYYESVLRKQAGF